MKTRIIFFLAVLAVIPVLFSSCLNDLNTMPLDPHSQDPDKVYSVEANYKKALFKIYSVFAQSGLDGPGNSDIDGLDAGKSQLYRCWWNMQEISTDEVIFASTSAYVSELTEMKWTSTKNDNIEGFYYRCMYIVALTNEYLKQTTDDKMASRHIRTDFMPTVHSFRDEARFVRALAYYMLMDEFGKPPFITEDNYTKYPAQIDRKDLFKWLESELTDLAKVLPKARSQYGRADQGCANALLARMYLNAEVYTGTPRYTDCIKACNAVINDGYSLVSDYKNLFRADNDKTSSNEIIFAISQDGKQTQSYGGTTFLILGSRGASDINLATDGMEGAWGNFRARPDLVEKFDFSNPDYAKDHDVNSILDKRGIFYAKNRTLKIDDWQDTFATQGWDVYKYSNLTSTGVPGSDVHFADTDIPVFRLAEIYLDYAEAVKRGGTGGSLEQAVQYINRLRERGYGNAAHDIQASDMDLDFILNERSRELYWEAVRRTDLVRYNYFTTSKYLWNFKGGAANGTSVEDFRNLYPIPVSDLTSNPSLVQNPGY